MSKLQLLVGKKVTGIRHELGRTIPLEQPLAREVYDLFLQVVFDEFSLNIYNNHSLSNSENIDSIVNETLLRVEESDSEIVFVFGTTTISVDMSDEGFTGPEALLLHGPNNLIVVWR